VEFDRGRLTAGQIAVDHLVVWDWFWEKGLD